MSFKPGSIVRVPFPFVDSGETKYRPALVLSNEHYNFAHGHSVMAMITSAKHSSWPSDVAISDLTSSGLKSASIVRFKLFTLDHRLVANQVGRLETADWIAVIKTLEEILPS